MLNISRRAKPGSNEPARSLVERRLQLKILTQQLGPGLVRAIWFSTGMLALLLGGIGAILPILPTTPFIILAAFCFGKSSPQLQALLEESRLFGPMIADWRENGAIATRYKAIAVTMMAAVFALSIWFAVPVFVLVIQAVCLTGAAFFVLSRPSA